MVVDLARASPAHVGIIASRMREADRTECLALGYSPKQALRLGIMGSEWAVTAKVDGRAEAMFGLTIVSAIEGEGRPWMLGTDAIYRHGRDLLAVGPEWVRRCLDSSRSLSNVVMASNGRAIRVLKRWGFEVGSDVQMIGGYPFHTFTMER